jgi:hypothetical protein
MEAEGILTTLAEVAIAIAGFSGIVVALQNRTVDLSETDKLRFSALLQVSFGAVFFSFVPIVLYLMHPSEPFVWRWSSGLWLVYIACTAAYRVPQLRRFSVSGPRADTSKAALGFLFIQLCTSVLLQVANVVWLRVSWPHVVTNILGMFLAFVLFVRLLRAVICTAAQQVDESDVE